MADESIKVNPPKHVAIIMDGNGRWATQRGKSRIAGHKNGIQAVRKSVRYAAEHGVEQLTLYAFSSENWSRPAVEVNALMELFMMALQREVKKLRENNIRLLIVGDISRFSPRLQKKINDSMKLTEHNKGLILNIAANYGGRWDIVQACKKLIDRVEIGELTSRDVNEDIFSHFLVTENRGDVDLLIRTSGEQRISNFLLWQVAYAELYFCDVLWPDFGENELAAAFESYSKRERRFGGSE